MKTSSCTFYAVVFLILLTNINGSFLHAQKSVDTTFRNELYVLKKRVANITNINDHLDAKVDLLIKRLDSLDARLSNSDISIENTRQNLEATKQENNVKISALDQLLGNTARNWMLGIMILAALSAGVSWWLRQRILSGESSVKSQIASTVKTIEETQKSLTEETVKLDTKLSDILESQLKIEQAERSAGPEKSDEDADHSLALKVADEILRINKNLSNMDPDIKGLKQLSASVKRIEDNFAANGYTMPELLGRAVHPGMRLTIANTISDENLPAGEEIITRIIKPQVNYKGIMIQAAQVEVSIGQ